MFRSSLKIAFRNLFKHPLYGMLNLGGFALGLAAAFILLLYAYQQLTYDQHFRNADRIYRVGTDFFNMGGFACSQPALHEAMRTEFKDVETATRFDRNFQETDLYHGERHFRETGLYYIDSAFFDVFSYEGLHGPLRGRHLAADEVLLMEPLARRLFGDSPAAGQTIRLGKDRTPYRVTGIVREPDGRSHLQPAIFLAYQARKDPTNWTSASVYNYVKLRQGAVVTGLEASLASVLRHKVYPASGTELSFEDWQLDNSAVRFFVQPLRDIYLYSDYKFEVSPGGNPQVVHLLGLIGLFIVFLSAVNYVNLTTARSSIRAREVGVKKAVGAGRRQLIGQFLGESLCFVALAMLLAAGMVEVLQALFEQISGEALTDTAFFNGPYLLAFLGFSLLVGLLAGAYPAFYLTGFRPVQILRGEESLSGNPRLRGGLVTLQFAIATGLMIASLVVYRQLQYIQEKDLGFEQKGVLVVDNYGALKNDRRAFRQRLEQFTQVERTSESRRLPAGRSIWMYTYRTPPMDNSITVQTFPVDDQFLPALGIDLLRGRNFAHAIDRDTSPNPVILNEAAVRALQIEGDPLGVEVNPDSRVVGVVRDFHFQALSQTIEPAALVYVPDGNTLSVRLRGTDMADFLATLQAEWQQFATGEPLQYYFLDENFEQLARSERMLSRAVAFFTVLAIIIACLGLFGLAAFTAERRTKEIGIRKILGASSAALAVLLSRAFLRYVLLAMLLAVPLVWWGARRWLDHYAYRIELSWWLFVLPGLLTLLIALLTVSFQSVRTALTNPVEALRYE